MRINDEIEKISEKAEKNEQKERKFYFWFKCVVGKKQEEIRPSLEDILGFDSVKSEISEESQKENSKEKIDEDKLSNSSSVLENELLIRDEESRKNENKIEIAVELTEEQKIQEEMLMFGSLPRDFNSIGVGINASQNQRDFIKSIE